ncbi:EAL domain-containing protein [Sulfurimonas marina]|uniref:EAL domain-containing protein n=1 Tax=Sulfurimonas marina TaxID=2590551 RepID=A0A7M1ASV8_9BACT|nr:EAL domain-containing protein [Sulfurimonas marina]QOP40496.1 EAL domain-containing protein [Sulfurimonas marina]
MVINLQEDNLNSAINKLKVREDILHEFSMLSGLGNWAIDLKTHSTKWSESLYNIYQIPKNTPINFETFLNLILPEYVEEAKQIIAMSKNSKDIFSFQAKAKRGDGKIIDILIHGKTLFDEDDTPLKFIGSTQDITNIIKLQQEAKELSELVKHSSNEIYIVDFDTLEYLYVNEGATKALLYTKEELLEMSVQDVNPYLKHSEIENLKQLLENNGHILNKTIHQRKNGTLYYVQSYLHIIEYQNKKSYVIFDTDISQIVELESEYKKQAKILENIHDSVISVDNCGNIVTWNNGSQRLFGYEAAEVIGRNIKLIYSKNNKTALSEYFEDINDTNNINDEFKMIKKDGSEIICDISLSVSTDNHNNITGYIGYIQDITKQKETKKMLDIQTEKLRHQAHHDMLTNLPNRVLFRDRLNQNIATAKRYDKKFALLFIDLDQFKNINDSLGHHIGDEVLIEASKRLSSVIREEDTLARLGGDEFTIILKDIKDAKSATIVAQKIIDILKDPIIIQELELYVSSSIGIAVYPDDTKEGDNLLKYADAAMYKAKDEGRNNYQYYSSEMTESAFERVIMEQSLRVAIQQENFLVYYQPQIDSENKKVVGMEALVRWEHPDVGIVSPANFIPLAEETGMIIHIDLIVLKKAMTQFKEWYQQGLTPGKLSLNLSAKQIENNNFIEILSDTMQTLEFDPAWLTLEVTESQIMKNPEDSIEKLKEINALGIEIAIDDFGTGYSSLAYLKKLPLNKLKIDKAFVDGLPHDEEDIAISRAIIALAKILNLDLIAEGVETKEQQEFMLENGCKVIQGYYYSKPIDSNSMEKFLLAI